MSASQGQTVTTMAQCSWEVLPKEKFRRNDFMSDFPTQSVKGIFEVCEHVPVALYSFKINHNTGSSCFPYMDPSCQDMFGISAKVVMEDPIIMVNLVHPDDAKQLADAVIQSMSDLSMIDQTLRQRHPLTQKYLKLRERCIPRHSQESNPETGDMEDVTIWKGFRMIVDVEPQKKRIPEAAAEVGKAEEAEDMRASTLLMESPIALFFSVNANSGRITQWNKVMIETTGLQASEVLEKDALTLFYFPNVSAQGMGFRQIILSSSKLECILKGKDGVIFQLMLSGQASSKSIFSPSSTIYVLCKDLTNTSQNPMPMLYSKASNRLFSGQQQPKSFVVNNFDIFSDLNPLTLPFTGETNWQTAAVLNSSLFSSGVQQPSQQRQPAFVVLSGQHQPVSFALANDEILLDLNALPLPQGKTVGQTAAVLNSVAFTSGLQQQQQQQQQQQWRPEPVALSVQQEQATSLDLDSEAILLEYNQTTLKHTNPAVDDTFMSDELNPTPFRF